MRAIALISGGLDSVLAARIIQEEGIKVLPLNFKIPFCQRSKSENQNNSISALVKESLAEELETVDISVDFLDLVLKPKYGFGSNMNPCIDCKIFMLRKAKELMLGFDAQFIVTGEVLGQRPMSQHRKALDTIEKESGLSGLLLRPLCAGLLSETLPEKEGWVKRQRLFEFNGRERRPQMNLADKFNIKNYPNASGGCLLTDTNFSNRLKDLITHRQLGIENVELLKIGRHFRLTETARLVVGRNEKENKELAAVALENDYLFAPDEFTAGPTCLGKGEFCDDLVRLSAQIAGTYCDLNSASNVKILYTHKRESYSIEIKPLPREKLSALRL
ncbi:MAG: tRNA 4-thiouridine(8) synthase ThiI [Candidatus Omnitrophota bacterium]|jgi:tRNA U34 2-thiouridine synthase MnmA/TrmU